MNISRVNYYFRILDYEVKGRKGRHGDYKCVLQTCVDPSYYLCNVLISDNLQEKNTKEKVCVGVFRWKRFDSIYMLRRKSIERDREKILMDQGGRNSGSRGEEARKLVSIR